MKQNNRDKIISTIYAIVKMQPKRRTHWVGFVHKQYCDSHACAAPNSILDYIKEKTEKDFILNIKFKKN